MGMQQAALQRFCSDDMEDHTGDERIHFDTRRLRGQTIPQALTDSRGNLLPGILDGLHPQACLARSGS